MRDVTKNVGICRTNWRGRPSMECLSVDMRLQDIIGTLFLSPHIQHCAFHRRAR